MRPLVPFRIVAALLLCGGLACGESAPPETVRVGLMLSYTGFLAANSTNSEHALLMAFDAANAAGGVGGRRIEVLARDTRSDPASVAGPARELLDADVAIFIGPDTTDLATMLRPILQGRTMILPSYATASDVEFKPPSWFVMGPGLSRVACELLAQARADGRTAPLVIVNATGYNSSLSFQLSNQFGIPNYVLPSEASTTASVAPITSVAADAYLLAAFPPAASSLVFALTGLGALEDPSRWYLSPTLHTPAFLESIPQGVLTGAKGVSPGTTAEADEFRAAYEAQWEDYPLDDAYPFYDAGAVTALALQRARVKEGAIPGGTGLDPHVIGVTTPGGLPVQWNEIGRGLQALAEGQEIEYVGLSGPIQFDLSGQAQVARTKWWTIGPPGFEDIPSTGECP
jgi:branched-chain amino acid transport system substrate-binding protein